MLSSRAKAKVLIIDDDVMSVQRVAEALSPVYDVFISTTGHEGLEQAQALSPELILLDVVMPGLSGFEVCRQLKQNEQTQPIPIIFVTAQDTVHQQTEGFELGAVDYITKPIEEAILKARVQTHTHLYQQTLQLESLAATDPLTGLANRRRFDEAMLSEIDHCHREQACLSLLIIDIDDFKAYNDGYGHGKGDDCLVHVARNLEASVHRATDLVSRLGGEEFGVILTATDQYGAQAIAAQILNIFNKQKHVHDYASQHDYLTVSIGIVTTAFSQITDYMPNERILVDCADEALYRAKHNGRNRYACNIWPPEPD